MSFLSVRNLSARVKGGGPLLRDVSLDVAVGEVRGLVGESGAGKSMIGKAVLGILPKAVEIISGQIMLDGVDICLEQVKRGMAWHYKQYQNEQAPHDRVAYAESENLARSNRTGLWQDSSPVEPTAIRHKK